MKRLLKISAVLFFWMLLLSGGSGFAQKFTLSATSATPVLTNHYTQVQFTMTLDNGTELAAGVGTITVTFPAGFGVPASISTDYVTVDGINAFAVSTSGQQVIITVPVTLRKPGGDDVGVIVIGTGAKIRIPGTAGSYTFTVGSSIQAGVRTSSAIAVTASSTTVTSAAVTPNTSVEYRSAQYQIQFAVGAGGYLTASSKVYIDFPVGTTVPNGTISGVTLNGQSVTTSGNSTTRRVTIDVPGEFDNSASITVVFGKSAGLKNPVQGGVTLAVSTTSETTSINSQTYTISSADDLSFSAITASNDTVNALSSYEVEFVLSNTGELSSAAADEIRLSFPTGFVVPASIPASAITIENLTSGFANNPASVSVAGQQITLTVSLDFSGSDEVKVTFLSAASIRNYSIASSYQLTVGTYESGGAVVIDAVVNSNPFALTAATSTVSNASVSLSSSIPATTAGYTNVTYTFTGTVGGYGALVAGTSTFTITFPSGTPNSTTFGTLSATLNGVSATASISTSGRELTFTVPGSVNIINSGAFTIVIGGVNNPSTGTYTAQIKTSVEATNSTTQSYNCGTSSLTVDSVTLGNAGANQTSAYTFAMSGATALKSSEGGSVTLLFPEGTVIPASIAATDVTINGSVAGNVTTNQTNRSISATVSYGNAAPTAMIVSAAAGVRNPPIVASSYTIRMYTSKNVVPATSPTYSISGNATSVTAVTASATPAVANGAAAQFQVAFTTGANGRLVGGLAVGSSTITVTFVSGATVPASMATSTVLIDGIRPASITTNVGAGTIQMTLDVGQVISNSSVVNIDFASAAGIVKSAVAGTYTVQVRTSAETTNSTGTNNLTLGAASVLSVGSTTVSPNTANASASYTIRFTPGTLGGLTAGQTFNIVFPSNTYVPTSIPTTYILVNGVYPNVVATGSGQTLTITSPSNLSGDALVTVQISSVAGVLNPTTPGSSYSLQVQTPSEGPSNSPVYTITTAPVSTITQPTVSLSAYGTVAANTSYTIGFNTGTYGRLIAGTSTITITFPATTAFGTVSATINGVAVVTIGSSGQSRTFTVPASVNIGNGSAVSLVVAGITNPTATGNYTLSAYTSVETSSVTSASYPISNAAPVTITSLTFTDLTVNAPTDMTLAFTVDGTAGALGLGTGTVTITFPAGFTIPASVDIATSSIQINAVNVSSVSSNTNNNTLTLTTGVAIANGATVTVVIGTTSNIRNMSEPGSYTFDVKTSQQPVVRTSSPATTFVASVATQLTSLTVSASPVTTLSPVTWTWTFTTGSRGGLKAGTGQVSLNFDQSVFTIDPIPPTAVEVNGSTISTLSKLGSVITITIPSNVTIGVNSAVTVVFRSGAGIKVDPTLGKTVGTGQVLKAENIYEAYSSPEPNPSQYNGNPLPVVLAEFKVVPFDSESHPIVQWTTFTEQDNYGFYVVRKTAEQLKSGTGTELGFITGNGTSYNPIDYSFIDSTVTLAGAYTYELYQEDYNSERKLIASAEFVMKAPDDFELENIYPNPFNPTTTIKYTLRNSTDVKIYVYDITGRLVSKVVDGVQPAGVYAPQFVANRLASGLYLVRFQAAGKVMMRKMLLVK